MRSLLFPIFLSLSVAACSSDSNDLEGSTSNAGSTSGANSESNFRVSTLTIEPESAGRLGSLIEYGYDSAGRIETIQQSFMDPINEPRISMFTYGASGVQTRSFRYVTETFGYDNGRISQIMYDTIDNPISYTYDSSGKLIGIIGNAFQGRGDCRSIDNTEAELPVFEIAYIGDQLKSITESTGAVTNFEYNQQGLLVRNTRTEDCLNEEDSYIIEYTYSADGLPLTETLSYFDSRTGSVTEREEQVATYTDGRLVQLVETSIDNDIDREITTKNFSYGANGRLETVKFIDEHVYDGVAGIDDTGITIVYGYEEGSCVKQLSAYPEYAITANLTNMPDEAFLNLHCAFTLDGL